jgi:hypothetical protein
MPLPRPLLAVPLVAFASLLACSDGPTGPDLTRVAAIDVSGLADTLFAFGKDTALAAVRNGRQQLVDTAVVRWSSSDTTTFVVVDSTGVVTARDGGDAWLRATALDYTDSVRVHVDYRPITTPVPFVAYSHGLAGDCGVAADGASWCRAPGGEWTEVPGGRRFRDVQSGQIGFCGLGTDDVVSCWGNTFGDGEFGTGGRDTRTSVPVTSAAGRAFTQLTVGSHRATCALGAADSLAWCWGHNDFSQTGRMMSHGEPTPMPVPGAPKMRQVALGLLHGCGIAVDDSTWCWGTSANARPEFYVPARQVAPPGLYTQVVTPDQNVSCGLLADGGAECWYATETMARTATVARVATSARFVRLYGGGHASVRLGCGLTANGELHCWNSSVNTHYGGVPAVATRRMRNRTFRFVSHDGLCAIATDGKVYC